MPDIHPMDAKKELARRLVAQYHSQEEGDIALADFNTRFSKKDLDHAELPVVSEDLLGSDVISAVVAAYAGGFQMTKSRGDARRLVEQGSVQWQSEKITDPKAVLSLTSGGVLRLDKTRAVRVG